MVGPADHLGFARFHLFAASGGAPYALACASRLSKRVLGTGICCGLAEVARAELLDGMSGLARSAFYLARRHPLLLKYTNAAILNSLARLSPATAIDLLASLQGEADRRLLHRAGIRGIFAENLREAFRQGPAGALADLRTAIEPWPFDLADVTALWLWHGDRDRVVPLDHSLWLAQSISDAELKIVEGEGHFSLPIRYNDEMIRAVLAATAGHE